MPVQGLRHGLRPSKLYDLAKELQQRGLHIPIRTKWQCSTQGIDKACAAGTDMHMHWFTTVRFSQAPANEG